MELSQCNASMDRCCSVMPLDIDALVGLCRSVASASEAAKAGIPMDTYQDSSQVCTKIIIF